MNCAPQRDETTETYPWKVEKQNRNLTRFKSVTSATSDALRRRTESSQCVSGVSRVRARCNSSCVPVIGALDFHRTALWCLAGTSRVHKPGDGVTG